MKASQIFKHCYIEVVLVIFPINLFFDVIIVFRVSFYFIVKMIKTVVRLYGLDYLQYSMLYHIVRFLFWSSF